MPLIIQINKTMSALSTSQTNPHGHFWLSSSAYQLNKVKIKKQDFMKVFIQPSGTNMQGMCSFENGFTGLYPLLKGLVLLGKPSWLQINNSNTESAIFFYFPKEKDGEMKEFLNKTIGLLEQEIQFKAVLNQILLNKRRFSVEQSLLLNSLIDN